MPRSPISSLGGNVLPLKSSNRTDAVGIAMRWLMERHRKGWRVSFEKLLDEWCPEHADHSALSRDVMHAMSTNAGEWLFARGEVFAKGETRSINAYLLSPDGPHLTPDQQSWIAQLRDRPLRLYRITDVRQNEGLTMVDALDLAAAPLVVQERSGSRSMKVGMLIAARVMHWENHLELSGAIYGFSKLHETSVITQTQQALEDGLHSENSFALAELTIARCWLAQWLEPAPMPVICDAGSGDAILLVTDHYRVCDADALNKALAAQPDVSGNAIDGWQRNSNTGTDAMRSIAAINPGNTPDRIEIFYRTQRMADEGRGWFESLAGAAVQHVIRETTDPRSPAARAGASKKATSVPDLAPEDMERVVEKVLLKQYANWADEPIPALGDLTPRQAIQTPAGLERVKGLLRMYEDGEMDMAKRDGRRAFSYQFLWDALEISRHDFV